MRNFLVVVRIEGLNKTFIKHFVCEIIYVFSARGIDKTWYCNKDSLHVNNINGKVGMKIHGISMLKNLFILA